MIGKIVSGGQTGADRAGLDVALARGMAHGGWCPNGRGSEDGPIPSKYQLTETRSARPVIRTERNVMDSDGTVVFTLQPEARGGSQKTICFAKKHGKPCLHLSAATPAPAEALRCFVEENAIGTLNVAGSRESGEPGIHAWVEGVLAAALEQA